MKINLKNLLLILFLTVIMFGCGIFAGVKYISLKNVAHEQGTNNTINIGNLSLQNPGQDENKGITPKTNQDLSNDTPTEAELSYIIENNVNNVFGFIKEMNNNGFILEYFNSQFVALDTTKLEKGLIQRQVNIIASTSIIENITPKTSESETNHDSLFSDSGVINAGDNNPETMGLNIPISNNKDSKIITIKDLKAGDYVRIISSNDVILSKDPLNATEVKLYPLTDNPYLKGNFTSYEKLPLSLSGITIKKLVTSE